MNAHRYKVLDVKTNRISRIERWDNGIICIKTNDHSQTEKDDILFQYNYIESITTELRSAKILTEPGLYSSISSEARELTSKPEFNRFTKASAVVVKSLPQRLLVNFIVSLQQKKEMRMKVFDSRERAITWLLNLP